MQVRDENIGGVATLEYFTALPSGDGFEVRDEVLGRDYHVPRSGAPTHQGQPVTNLLTLDRIQSAVEKWVEQALVEEVAGELRQAA